MSSKKKLYYLLGSKPRINTLGGDSINEMNNIKYLSKFYDIYYNNQYLDLTKKDFNQNKTKIEDPDRNYDIYYVRNNKKIFLKTPKDKIKIWFASPYQKDCFSYADYICCLTFNWKKMLSKPNSKWGILYPNDYFTNKTLVLSQKIDPNLFYPIANINVLNLDNKIFKICHFGSFRNSCFPSFLLRLYDSFDKETKKKIKIIFIGNIPVNFKKNYPDFLFIDNIPFEEVNKYINSCQLLLYNQRDYQSEYAGSNKIIEAIVCNKPILSVRSQARIEELGHNYPLFYNLLVKPPDNPKNIFKESFIDDKEVKRIKIVVKNMINNSNYYNEIVNYMKNIDKTKYLTNYNINQLEKL